MFSIPPPKNKYPKYWNAKAFGTYRSQLNFQTLGMGPVFPVFPGIILGNKTWKFLDENKLLDIEWHQSYTTAAAALYRSKTTARSTPICHPITCCQNQTKFAWRTGNQYSSQWWLVLRYIPSSIPQTACHDDGMVALFAQKNVSEWKGALLNPNSSELHVLCCDMWRMLR